MARRRKAKKRRSFIGRLVRWLLTLLLLGVVAGIGTIAATFWYFGRDLPDIRSVEDYVPKQVTRIYASTGEVIATFTDDELIYRTVVPLEQIPDVMQDAILAAEDAGFREHKGLDFVGLLRAVYTNIRRGELSQGASTITQQVVKNLVLSPERTIRRKVQEALLAFRLERMLTKDEILEIYLNEVYFGGNRYGVEEAARYYFGHGAEELDLAQAATLAGLVQSPARYNPYRHRERALVRRSYVLRQLYEKGFIEEAVYRRTEEEDLVLAESIRGPYEGRFPYYVDAVRRELERLYGAERTRAGGLHVTAALDIDTQTRAQQALRTGLIAFDESAGLLRPYRTLEGDAAIRAFRDERAARLGSVLEPGREYRGVVLASDDETTTVAIGPHELSLDRSPAARFNPDDRAWDEIFARGMVFTVVPTERIALSSSSERGPIGRVQLVDPAQAAIVAIEPDSRHVVALVGGFDYRESSFNRAVQANRQVGSAIKPIIYAAALAERSITPATILPDEPTTYRLGADQLWSPRNYDGRYLGPMRARTALARSRNVTSVRVLDGIGVSAAQRFARSVGVESPLPDNLTLALGSAEMTPLELTNAFATFAASGVRAEPVLILAIDGPRGGAVDLPADATKTQAVPAEVSWLITSMMRSVVLEGTAGRARSVPAEVVGKTGTTNGPRDAWFVGYSPALVAGVWVGRDDNSILARRASGGTTALPIWVDFMTGWHEGRETPSLADPPAGIVQRRIDEETGLLARPGGEGATREEYFLEGTEPRRLAPVPQERTIDEVLLRPSAGGAPPGSGAASDPGRDGF